MHEGLSPVFHNLTARQFEAVAPDLLSARIRRLDREQEEFRASAARRIGDTSNLWFCNYDADLALTFSEADYYRIQMPLDGQALTEEGRRETVVGGEVGCISRGVATLAFKPGFRQFAWRVPVVSLTKTVSALIGEPLVRRLDFDAALDLAKPSARRLPALAKVLAESPDPSKLGHVVDKEIEQAMIVALLAAADHTYREALQKDAESCAPRQVRAVEMYIEEHWQEPLDYEVLANVSTVSVRTLFRTFKSFRGYTPLEFAKKIRLQHAHDMLLSGDGMTVGAIAAACGFPNFSAFSRDFAAAYGQSPSSLRYPFRRLSEQGEE